MLHSAYVAENVIVAILLVLCTETVSSLGFSNRNFLSSSQNRDLGGLQDALLLLKSIKLLRFVSALCACVVLWLVESEHILKP